MNPQIDVKTVLNGWESTEPMWRSINVKGAANIPILMDALWCQNFPHSTDRPPLWNLEGGNADYNPMNMFCFNRHNGTMNGVFMDTSVRAVGLKELWRLKWNRDFDFSETPTTEEFDTTGNCWMRKFKDYQ